MTDEAAILNLISTYIESKQTLKKWEPGKDWVQYAGDYFSSAEYVAAVKTLLKGWLVLGQDATKFEREFPKLFHKQYGLLTNSGSSANLLMMLTLTSKRGQMLPKNTKVIVPVAGFPTTINPLLQVGFQPIFVDIELDTLNLNLDQVEEACHKNPDAKIITFAHVLGNPPDMDRVMDICRRYHLVLLEDCCDALGSCYGGKPLGSFGDMASCSFYPAHHITMGEGGIVTFKYERDEQIARSFREWGRGCHCVGKEQNLLANGSCNHRFSNWLPSLPDYIFDHKYVYEEIGYNLKPIELQASIGLVQLQKLPVIGALRRRNYQLLHDMFSKYEDIFIIHEAQPNSDPNWFAFPVTMKKGNRSEICQFFEAHKIQTRPYFAGNILLHPAYSTITHQNPLDFKIATKVTTDTFFLGTSPVVTEDQIRYIGQILDKFINEN